MTRAALALAALTCASCAFDTSGAADDYPTVYYIDDDASCLVSWGIVRPPGTNTIIRTGSCSAICGRGSFEVTGDVEFEMMPAEEVPAKCSQR